LSKHLKYTSGRIRKLLEIVCSAAQGTMDLVALEMDLFYFLNTQSPLGDPDKARHFAAIAAADNPLDPAICHGEYDARLNGMIHNRWSARWRRQGRGDARLRAVNWAALSEAEQRDVREMALHLALYHRSQIPAHRPQKKHIDEALCALAEVFASHTGATRALKLPHARTSRFIQFAHAALVPLLHVSEAAEESLSRRWKALKIDKAAGLEPTVRKRRPRHRPPRKN
jgi:hypothetical protein